MRARLLLIVISTSLPLNQALATPPRSSPPHMCNSEDCLVESWQHLKCKPLSGAPRIQKEQLSPKWDWIETGRRPTESDFQLYWLQNLDAQAESCRNLADRDEVVFFFVDIAPELRVREFRVRPIKGSVNPFGQCILRVLERAWFLGFPLSVVFSASSQGIEWPCEKIESL